VTIPLFPPSGYPLPYNYISIIALINGFIFVSFRHSSPKGGSHHLTQQGSLLDVPCLVQPKPAILSTSCLSHPCTRGFVQYLTDSLDRHETGCFASRCFLPRIPCRILITLGVRLTCKQKSHLLLRLVAVPCFNKGRRMSKWPFDC
jgi:hypothetical protein